MAFCEKPPQCVDLAKSRHFLCKLPCFRVFTQFLEKSWKKHDIFRETTKKFRSRQNQTLFQQTTMFQGVDPIFSKKLQKLWHFVKNQKNVSISPKLDTFCANYNVLGFEQIFSKKLQRLWHFVKNHQNVSISSKLATSCAKYHVLGF